MRHLFFGKGIALVSAKLITKITIIDPKLLIKSLVKKFIARDAFGSFMNPKDGGPEGIVLGHAISYGRHMKAFV